MIAQHLALDHSERVASLALLATSATGGAAMLSVPENVSELPGLVLSSADRRNASMVHLIFGPRAIREQGVDALARQLAEDSTRPPSLMTLLAHRRAIAAHDTRTRLWALADIPTLIVGATHDRVIHPDHTRFLATALPHARLLVREECGHALHREFPGEVAAELRSLFARAR
jgi:pimeloyl-ACP methyl ester carboxylesterase